MAHNKNNKIYFFGLLPVFNTTAQRRKIHMTVTGQSGREGKRPAGRSYLQRHAPEPSLCWPHGGSDGRHTHSHTNTRLRIPLRVRILIGHELVVTNMYLVIPSDHLIVHTRTGADLTVPLSLEQLQRLEVPTNVITS